MQNIDEFIEGLLNDKGVTDVEPEVRTELKAELKQQLLDQINRAAVMRLSEEQADELARLVEDPNFTEEQMTEFMANSGVDLTQVTLDTMLRFRGFYLGNEG